MNDAARLLTIIGALAALHAAGAAPGVNAPAGRALQSAHPALVVAAGARRHAEVRKLIEQGADPNDCDKHGRTALEILLAKDGPLDLVRLLISRGADVNREGEHLTPLGTAIYYCRIDALPMLLSAGARLDIPVGLRRPLAREFAAKYGCPAARAVIEQSTAATPR